MKLSLQEGYEEHFPGKSETRYLWKAVGESGSPLLPKDYLGDEGEGAESE